MTQIINIILGADEGQFTVTECFNKGKERTRVTRKFPANEPEKVLEDLKKVVNKWGKIDGVLTSSSIDFPEEEGVSKKEVDSLFKVLERKLA